MKWFCATIKVMSNSAQSIIAQIALFFVQEQGESVEMGHRCK
jgi:hypothetical protein